MIGKSIVFLLSIFLADARVDFNHSRIFDEFDFKGQATVAIDGLCKDTCRIYASITQESKKFASNILIQTSKGFVSIADVASRVDPTTNQKLFLEINNVATLYIDNANSQMNVGPLVLYVVNKAGSNFGYAEIYEAEDFHRPFSTMVGALTVMSARPFTLKQAHLEGNLEGAPEGVLAQMAGYDALGYATDPCPYLYYLLYGPFPGFTMEVNGPIISLLYDLNQFHFPPGDLTATIGITNRRQLERAGWAGSPGFHGCLDKQPYRSSLYDFSTPFHAEVTNDQPESISVDVVTNSDDAHPVTLTDPENGSEYSISATADSKPVSFNFNAKNLTINWTPDGSGNTHFLVRWNSTMIPHS
ncbi:hypothetical protein PENTCL1PPCAC_16766 [Pristionchus entomophagus]|uniref:Uncharacterized protein n=1 Tax=Pristionchus entomophagus TaxID=358040 RepID=A0AAV5TJX2_9BILA|nr:hypothetical protein PENTCL1PPCAC_16766 [Pristionchus entomophagus]